MAIGIPSEMRSRSIRDTRVPGARPSVTTSSGDGLYSPRDKTRLSAERPRDRIVSLKLTRLESDCSCRGFCSKTNDPAPRRCSTTPSDTN